MTDVLAIGETMLVLRTLRPGRLAVRDRLEAGAAGAESNVAIGLARLGHDVELVGVVGGDDAGGAVLGAVRAEGVRWGGRVDPDRATGLLLRTDPAPWLAHVGYYRQGSAGAQLSPADLAEALGRAPRIVHTSGVTASLSGTARATVVSALTHAGTASYDVNFRSRLTGVADAAAVLAEVLPSLHVLFCGEDELPVLAAALGRPDLTLDAALSLDIVPELVIKSGAHGAASRVDGTSSAVASHPVEVVDEVGAGDAFAAGYLSALLDGAPPAERLARGCLVAAYCVAGIGDTDTLPTRADLSRQPASRTTVR